jgi:hypothetical protein
VDDRAPLVARGSVTAPAGLNGEQSVVDFTDVAVLVPCHNEAQTIAQVVEDFRIHLPGARVVVCDNDSSDGTAEAARAAGALVITERRRGKGYAVRRLFSDVDANFFVMVDGDGTYDAARAQEMVRLMRDEGVERSWASAGRGPRGGPPSSAQATSSATWRSPASSRSSSTPGTAMH